MQTLRRMDGKRFDVNSRTDERILDMLDGQAGFIEFSQASSNNYSTALFNCGEWTVRVEHRNNGCGYYHYYTQLIDRNGEVRDWPQYDSEFFAVIAAGSWQQYGFQKMQEEMEALRPLRDKVNNLESLLRQIRDINQDGGPGSRAKVRSLIASAI